MIKKTPRYISVLVLDKVFNEGAYSNIILKKYLENNDIKDVDKNFITEIVYGTIKYKLTIDSIIANFVKKIDIKDVSTNILRSAVYQLKYLDKVPDYAVLNESVNISKELCKNKSKFINGVLRNYLRNKDVLLKNTLENEYSFDSWMIDLFKQQYTKDYKYILESLNKRGDIFYRINTNKITKEELLYKFKEYKFEGFENFRNAVKIVNIPNVTSKEIYKDGFLTIQDTSSQIACELLAPKQGDLIIDLCAAPGGKTTYLAELIKDNGKIISCDIYSHKINLINQHKSRLGLNSIKCFLNDALILNDEFIGIADKVVLDVPCSGFGIIKKKPEIKWSKKPENLEDIINIQCKIIDIACKYVKNGGYLMYTTCTLNKNENENIILNFLSRNKNFVIEQLDLKIFEGLKIDYFKGMATLLPSDVNDGFFICKLRKI